MGNMTLIYEVQFPYLLNEKKKYFQLYLSHKFVIRE